MMRSCLVDTENIAVHSEKIFFLTPAMCTRQFISTESFYILYSGKIFFWVGFENSHSNNTMMHQPNLGWPVISSYCHL